MTDPTYHSSPALSSSQVAAYLTDPIPRPDLVIDCFETVCEASRKSVDSLVALSRKAWSMRDYPDRYLLIDRAWCKMQIEARAFSGHLPCVYAIEVPADCDLVKIGYTADLLTRVRAIGSEARRRFSNAVVGHRLMILPFASEQQGLCVESCIHASTAPLLHSGDYFVDSLAVAKALFYWATAYRLAILKGKQ